MSLGTAVFLAGAAFAASVVVTAFTAFAGTQYETAPEDHRNDEHNARERDDNSGEPEGPPTAPMRFVPTPVPSRRRFGGRGCLAGLLRRCFSHDNHRYAPYLYFR